MEFELISTRDLFEDDDIVIISRIGKVFNAKVEIIDVAIKDENGDITVYHGSEAQDFRLFIICLVMKRVGILINFFDTFCYMFVFIFC